MNPALKFDKSHFFLKFKYFDLELIPVNLSFSKGSIGLWVTNIKSNITVIMVIAMIVDIAIIALHDEVASALEDFAKVALARGQGLSIQNQLLLFKSD